MAIFLCPGVSAVDSAHWALHSLFISLVQWLFSRAHEKRHPFVLGDTFLVSLISYTLDTGPKTPALPTELRMCTAITYCNCWPADCAELINYNSLTNPNP